jgi:hypothetical protein
VIEVTVKMSPAEMLRDNMLRFMAHCNCGGPQPSLESSRATEHAADCPYVACALFNPTTTGKEQDER